MSRVGRGVELRPPRLDPRQRLGERGQPRPGRAEVVAVLAVVALEPARTDAEDEPAVADVVDGARHVREQLRVAVRVARHERADLDPLGRLGPCGEHRPALEVLAVGLAVQREEVVPVEHHVDARLLGTSDGVADLAVVGVLRLDLHADAERSGHAGTLRPAGTIAPRSPTDATSATRTHQWDVPGAPLNGPTTRDVIQPP